MEDKSLFQRQVRALYEITEAINGSLSQQDVFRAILARIVTVLGYKGATLRMLDQERKQLELKASFGLSDSYLTKGPVDMAKSAIDRTVLTGQTVTIPDVRQDSSLQYPEAAAREGLASMIAVPLAVRDHVIGVLHVYTAEPHLFSAEEKELMSSIANLGAQAIQRTRLFDAFQRLAHQLNSSLDLAHVLKTLLVESVNELNVKAGSLRLLGPRRETLHLAAAYGLSETYLQKGEVQVAQSPIDQRVLKELQPIVIDDAQEQGSFQYPDEARREGIRSVLVLRLQVRDIAIGVLRLYSAQVRRFSTEEIGFASAIADLGAIAIENAKLHEALKQRLEAMKEDVDGWYRFLAFS